MLKLTSILIVTIFLCSCHNMDKNKELILNLERIDPETNKVLIATEKVSCGKVGIIVMDVWDHHWCKSWTAREAAMIPKMNTVLDAARKMGVLVIFSPTSVADFYKDYPQRKAVTKLADLKQPNYKSVWELSERNTAVSPSFRKYFEGTIFEAGLIKGNTYHGYPSLPPFAMTGGCECGPDRPCEIKNVWTRQNKDLIIEDNDVIVEGDNKDEINNLCISKGLTHLLYIGAAGNMCLTWTRETSIINMANRGFKPIIMEDLMISVTGLGYNPDTQQADPSFTPAIGDKLILDHLKKYIAPVAKTYEVFPNSN
jgi:nicotinamidase-related amidase